ncbi:hypothetical protein AG0111_0g4149 [Alternaria gaisen]|uniref:Uncharacterized protein n=1 Tax=Alternaria gaisen TaxID=167740 RepID=A0ACB6FT60_9PLEO|nr:hypothetical protein AG0111_0g4149 [Alternaria gaisen]
MSVPVSLMVQLIKATVEPFARNAHVEFRLKLELSVGIASCFTPVICVKHPLKRSNHELKRAVSYGL